MHILFDVLYVQGMVWYFGKLLINSLLSLKGKGEDQYQSIAAYLSLA